MLNKAVKGQVYAELYNFLNILPKEMKDKIPKDLISLITQNKDEKYIKDIIDISKEEFLPETRAYISVIYTDCLASEEERKIILAKEETIIKARHEDNSKNNSKDNSENKQEDYSNVLIIDEQESNIKINESLISTENNKWYGKLFNKIRAIFAKRK